MSLGKGSMLMPLKGTTTLTLPQELMVVYESVPFNLIESVSSWFNPYTSAVILGTSGKGSQAIL